jgi:hypothetical protein
MSNITFQTKHMPMQHDVVAPDGSEVRLLLGLAGGGIAHFELGPNQVSKAVTHRRGFPLQDHRPSAVDNTGGAQ